MKNNNSNFQLQFVKVSPMVKKLIIANVAIWIVGQLILDKMILPAPWIGSYLSLVPQLFVENFMVWQPLTYMFLHSPTIFHILFNMISLWFFASDLEYRWGSKSFLLFYLSTGIGAALIYVIGVVVASMIQGGPSLVFQTPVVGASGAVFGVLVAYALLFGERVIYFFGVFPMKAKFFILIMGGIEVVTLMSEGVGASRVANLAHIGGMITGLTYMYLWQRPGGPKGGKRGSKGKTRRNLRLVVNNDKSKKGKNNPDDPKYWN